VAQLGCSSGDGKVGVPKLVGNYQDGPRHRLMLGQHAAPACAGQQRPK
jgi:hypothetical protein